MRDCEKARLRQLTLPEAEWGTARGAESVCPRCGPAADPAAMQLEKGVTGSMRCFLLALLGAALAHSQVVTFGVKGGAPLGKPTADYGYLKVEPGYWTVGPTAEVHLPAGVSLEVSALFSRYTVKYPIVAVPSPPPSSPIYSSTGDVRAWDFPLALKYRFGGGPFRPFVLGGVNYRRENADIQPECHTAGAPGCLGTAYSTSQDRLGPVAGTGIEFRYRRVRIAPEFRYTHLNRPGAHQYGLLLGFTF